MNATLAKNQFWKWFQRNIEEYNSLDKKRVRELTYWCNELEVHLRAYCKNLTLEFRNDSPTGINQLIFSAGGNSRYFKNSDSLVAKAPVIPGWEFISLVPPEEIDCMFQQKSENSGIELS